VISKTNSSQFKRNLSGKHLSPKKRFCDNVVTDKLWRYTWAWCTAAKCSWFHAFWSNCRTTQKQILWKWRLLMAVKRSLLQHVFFLMFMFDTWTHVSKNYHNGQKF